MPSPGHSPLVLRKLASGLSSSSSLFHRVPTFTTQHISYYPFFCLSHISTFSFGYFFWGGWVGRGLPWHRFSIAPMRQNKCWIPSLDTWGQVQALLPTDHVTLDLFSFTQAVRTVPTLHQLLAWQLNNIISRSTWRAIKHYVRVDFILSQRGMVLCP